ncbi:MAG TPA: hypothetical protein VH139_04295, partial [Acidobacteriaceae bacterium]|nr:hypothetical protein [Acidobacteriaceae bacterium]
LSATAAAGTSDPPADVWFGGRPGAGLLATKVLSYIVYQASPRDPMVLRGVVLIMLLLGLMAAWIPAQRALSANPLMLLREE